MNINPNWMPMHWPCGPLEAARLAARRTVAPGAKEALAAWVNPQSLELLKGTPVNCLVIPWAAGISEDRAHQQAVTELIRAATAQGIRCVGIVATKQASGPVVEEGLKAGLAALVVESSGGLPKDAPVVLRLPRGGTPWESATSVFSIKDNLWPGLQLDNVQEGDMASAGPTGVPWVNSNGWLTLLARRLSREKTVWLEYEPPETSDLTRPANYSLAVADSAAYGSRWVVQLDEHLRAGLIQKDPRALKVWERLVASLAFFRAHSDWSAFQPAGFLTVISDFRGDREPLATEVLNLLARRHVQYKIIERSVANSAPLANLKAVLWVDEVAPSADVRARFLAFARRGGLLIAPTNWGPSGARAGTGGLLGRYDLYALGKGRIAVPKQGFADPYELAVDTHLLLSRRNDWVRVFNINAANAYCSTDAHGRRLLVRFLNYASSGSADFVSAWVRTTRQMARFWGLDSKEAVALRGVPSRGGIEFQLPSISSYAALEFELQGRR